MQDLTAILLGYGGLLVGYGSPLLAYLILRRKAQRNSAGRPIMQIESWRSFCDVLSVGLFLGAMLWVVCIADLFADLVLSLRDICPSLVTPDECSRAALNWQTTCVGLAEAACTALIIILCTIYAEAKSTTEPPPERLYQLVLLTWSHSLLVVSWLLCSPLTYPLKPFGLIGATHWTSVSSVFAFSAILTYIVGAALWIIALVKLFYAKRRMSRNGNPTGAQWPGGSERDVMLQDV